MPDLVAALDAVLFELEELNVRRVAVAPASCRQRVAELVADAGRLDAAPELPELVTAIMERVFEAQELAVLRRRRAGWGIEETPAGGAARSR